jgi:hypothetical protein
MIITADSGKIEQSTKLKEMRVNRDASEYFEKEYSTILENAKTKYHVKEDKAEDLVQDVYISILESEYHGNGFDCNYGEGRNMMLVEQFVYGRLKKFARNPKYSSDTIETGTYRVRTRDEFDNCVTDSDGNIVLDEKGKVKVSKRKVSKNMTSSVVVVAASNDLSESDLKEGNINEFQKAYSLAATADSSQDIVDAMSTLEEITYCVDLCNMHNFDIMTLFKNIDKLSDLLGSRSRFRKKAEPVFGPITELANEHPDFAEALMDVLHFSSSNRAAFDIILAKNF